LPRPPVQKQLVSPEGINGFQETGRIVRRLRPFVRQCRAIDCTHECIILMDDAVSQVPSVFPVLLRDRVGITKHELLLGNFAGKVRVRLYYRVRAAGHSIGLDLGFHPNAVAVTREKDTRSPRWRTSRVSAVRCTSPFWCTSAYGTL